MHHFLSKNKNHLHGSWPPHHNGWWQKRSTILAAWSLASIKAAKMENQPCHCIQNKEIISTVGSGAGVLPSCHSNVTSCCPQNRRHKNQLEITTSSSHPITTVFCLDSSLTNEDLHYKGEMRGDVGGVFCHGGFFVPKFKFNSTFCFLNFFIYHILFSTPRPYPIVSYNLAMLWHATTSCNNNKKPLFHILQRHVSYKLFRALSVMSDVFF